MNDTRELNIPKLLKFVKICLVYRVSLQGRAQLMLRKKQKKAEIA